MTRRSEDGGRTKVVAAARKLFQQKGFHQTAMAELSEQSEVSVGQIYRLFTSKSEMISAIIRQDTDERIKRLAEIRDAVASGACSARDGFRRASVEVLQQEAEALTFEILAEGFRNAAVGAEIGLLCERYRAVLREIVLAAGSAIEGPRLAAVEEMLLAILFGLGNRSLSRPVLSVEKTAEYAADMILAMLGV